MILSMTGFATSSVSLPITDGVSSILTITIKSLNARFFETTCKFPYALSPLENQIIKILKMRLHRGHVYCTMHVNNADVFGADVVPCTKTIASYVNALHVIKKKFHLDQPVTLDQIIRLEHIFETTERALDERIVALILQAIDGVVKQVIAERIREGNELLKDIKLQCSVINNQMQVVEEEAGKLRADQEKKIDQALHEVGGDKELLAELKKSSLFTILDRMDINEEIVRFKAHMHNLIIHLDAPLPTDEGVPGARYEKGKHLDFILQELAREINTIAAKCANARVSTSAISIKVAVEKIREQVQNIV